MTDDITPSHKGLRAIALFEAGKGAIALLVAGGLAAVGPDALQHRVEHVLARFGADADRFGTDLLDAITPQTLHIAIAVALIYAGMRLLEAWGLWWHRAWASWLGVIGAAAYLPFEIYALWHHPDWMTWGVFLVNLLIVLVLARDLYRRRAGG
ncbi:DUF2127 domain-containing protein [Luteimonas sp. S4-F44]|uniref:DUF2127 domain-containing protein n=1 Tax=Luteimonas sp. S4-F44 TaxID=2925842 RepID=UPI001F539129|nr:DUF2127 domain-containing protein [Luteimonas sp. S4-F44]UNK43355.1 DUF2127 domain-containing protein [Luteimonas sp. S4-F44]